MKHYDYIIAGAGCAGLSLLTRMIASGRFAQKRILVVDKSPRVHNDHTWCFWEASPGFFEPVVYKNWSQLYFHSLNRSSLMDIRPFHYKMIRAGDFYRYCFEQIRKESIDVDYGEITSISNANDRACLTFGGNEVSADYIFSSILPRTLEKQKGKHYLLQHFKGWMIETARPCFDADTATLMDFRMPQRYGACFMYLLPVSDSRAMVECTFFSKELVPPLTYDTLLKQYLSSYLNNMPYTVVEEENGIIPMTNHRFTKADGRIIYLGTAGGNTKPSSGYTFQFIQAHCQALVKQLIRTGHPYLQEKKAGRFLFYDTVLLSVLAEGKTPADKIFERLFCRNTPQAVLKFLNNDTNYLEEMKIISSLPKMPFIRAAIKELKASFAQ